MSILEVKKRDGRIVDFNPQKIIVAITKSFKSQGITNHKIIINITNDIINIIYNEPRLYTIQEIEKIVENSLMKSSYPNVARAYIEYRHERDLQREMNSPLTNTIKGLMEQKDRAILNENANKDSKVIPTQRDLLAGMVAKHYALQFILPKHIAEAHKNGDIHYHDLDYSPFFPMVNCCLVDLKNMLENGFRMGNAEIETPKSIGTATAITAQIIAQVSSHNYGGTTIDHIDTVLAPYVKASYNKNLKKAEKWHITDKEAFAKEETEKECYNAFQSLEYEINTLHTSNGQTPFVTLGFGLGTSWEERLIQKSIFENRIQGLGKNRKTAIFPKLVFAIKNGVNLKPTDPNYDIKQLALQCASKRMYPDILNYDRVVEATGSFKTPMGCRSFLHVYKDEYGNEVHDGRNNLGVVSVNLPRVALEAKGDLNKFWEILDDKLELCKEALLTRIKSLKNVKARVAPILYMEGAFGVKLKADDPIIEIFKNGRASISLGYIGIHETVEALINDNKHPFDSEEKRKLGKEIVQKLKDTAEIWKEETGYGFGLYSTPSENLCDRFCRLDKEKFGVIPNVTDKDYYTNSYHLDVRKKVNVFEKIEFEKDYPYIANSGFICYGEFPNMQKNIKALEKVWDYSYERVPYYGTNTPIDECYKCGYEGEFECTSKGFVCPKCGNHEDGTLSVTRRVCGYLGSPDARPFNEGKQQEVENRVKHLNNGQIG